MILHSPLVDYSHYPDSNYSNTRIARRRNLKPAHKTLLFWHLVAAVYFLNNNLCECMDSTKNFKTIDLTHVFDNTTIYWVTEPTLTLNVTYNGTIPGKDYWYQKDEFSAATHGGTHLDAPCHFAKGTWCVSDIPIERLIAPAVVVDISGQVNGNHDVHLTTQHLLDWEKVHGKIPNGSILFIYTGWSQFWPDIVKYTGTAERKREQLKFPSIQGDVAQWLISKRNIFGIGIDTMSIDKPYGNPDVHVTLMTNNIYALENVNNLDLMPPTGTKVFALPMNLKFASGAPCRIVAQLSQTPTNESGCSSYCSSVVYVLTALCAIFLLTI